MSARDPFAPARATFRRTLNYLKRELARPCFYIETRPGSRRFRRMTKREIARTFS